MNGTVIGNNVSREGRERERNWLNLGERALVRDE